MEFLIFAWDQLTKRSNRDRRTEKFDVIWNISKRLDFSLRLKSYLLLQLSRVFHKLFVARNFNFNRQLARNMLPVSYILVRFSFQRYLCTTMWILICIGNARKETSNHMVHLITIEILSLDFFCLKMSLTNVEAWYIIN